MAIPKSFIPDQQTAPTSFQPETTPAAFSPQKKSVGGFIGNVFKSGASLVGNTVSGIANVFNPNPQKNTLLNLGRVAVGGVEKLIPGQQGQEQHFDAVANLYKQRYGSLDAIKNTAYSDPFGLAVDASTLLGGAAGIASKIGKVGEISGATKVASTLGRVSQAIDPIATGLKATGIGAKLAPFGKSYNQEVASIAKERGVSFPASSLSKSQAVPVIESTVGKGLFGGKIAEKVERAGLRLNEIADETVRTAGNADPIVAGNRIQKGLEKFKDNYIETKNQLYKEATIPTRGKPVTDLQASHVGPIRVNVKNTVSFLDELLRGKKNAASVLGDSQDLRFFQNLRNKLDNPKLNARVVSDTMKELNKRTKNFNDPIATGNQGELQRITATLSDDLDNSIKAVRPDLAEKIDKANAYYQEGLNKLQTAYGKKIVELKDQPDKIVDAIVNPSSSLVDIPKIYEVVGPEAKQSIQANVLNRIFTQAKGQSGVFTQGGISGQIKKFGDAKLKAILEPNQYNAVKDLDQLSQALGKGQKVASGSQTAFVSRIVGEAITIGINPFLALKLVLGDAALSKFISSEAGQRFLTTGVNIGGSKGIQFRKAIPQISNFGKAGFQAGRVNQQINQ